MTDEIKYLLKINENILRLEKKIDSINKLIKESPRYSSSWSKKDLVLLQKNYGQMPIREIANLLKRTEGAVYAQITRMGIGKVIKEPITSSQAQYIIDNYLTMTYKDIAKKNGITVAKVSLFVSKKIQEGVLERKNK